MYEDGKYYRHLQSDKEHTADMYMLCLHEAGQKCIFNIFNVNRKHPMLQGK